MEEGGDDGKSFIFFSPFSIRGSERCLFGLRLRVRVGVAGDVFLEEGRGGTDKGGIEKGRKGRACVGTSNKLTDGLPTLHHFIPSPIHNAE